MHKENLDHTERHVNGLSPSERDLLNKFLSVLGEDFKDDAEFVGQLAGLDDRSALRGRLWLEREQSGRASI